MVYFKTKCETTWNVVRKKKLNFSLKFISIIVLRSSIFNGIGDYLQSAEWWDFWFTEPLHTGNDSHCIIVLRSKYE